MSRVLTHKTENVSQRQQKFQESHLNSYLSTDLVTALASLDVDDFTHFGRFGVFIVDSRSKKIASWAVDRCVLSLWVSSCNWANYCVTELPNLNVPDSEWKVVLKIHPPRLATVLKGTFSDSLYGGSWKFLQYPIMGRYCVHV